MQPVMRALLSVCLLAAVLALPAAAAAATPPEPQVALSTDPAVPVAGHKVTLYLYASGAEVEPGYPWNVRARPLAGGAEIPIDLRRIGAEPNFWQGEIVFPSSGDWQIVVGSLQSEAWPAPGTTPGNVLVPVVGGKSALAPNEFNAPWEVVMLSGGLGVVVGACAGWLAARKRPARAD